MEDDADRTEKAQPVQPTLSSMQRTPRKLSKPYAKLIVLYLLYFCEAVPSLLDFQGSESFYSKENSLLQVYSSALASKVSSLIIKKSDILQKLVTHVPDIIVNRLMDSKMEPPTMEKTCGVLVFADVSGYH